MLGGVMLRAAGLSGGGLEPGGGSPGGGSPGGGSPGGGSPGGGSPGGGCIPGVVLTSTLTVGALALPTARSGPPSPLRSPTASDCGWLPAPYGDPVSGTKPELSGLRRKTLTWSLSKFVTAKSARVSPLKSATSTSLGYD